MNYVLDDYSTTTYYFLCLCERNHGCHHRNENDIGHERNTVVQHHGGLRIYIEGIFASFVAL